MKVMYIGASHREGVSAKTGKPYSIAEIAYATPDEPQASKVDEQGKHLWTYTSHGFKPQTIEMEPKALAQFSAVKPCSIVDLDIEPKPKNPRVNWVIGVK